MSVDWILKRGGVPYDKPDVDCVTLPNGECIAEPCRLHDPPSTYKDRERARTLILYVKVPFYGKPEQDEVEARRIARSVAVSVDSRAEVYLCEGEDVPEARYIDPDKGRVPD